MRASSPGSQRVAPAKFTRYRPAGGRRSPGSKGGRQNPQGAYPSAAASGRGIGRRVRWR